MIELVINGAQQTLEPPSSADLNDHLHRSVPNGHVICSLLVNGLEVDEARLDAGFCPFKLLCLPASSRWNGSSRAHVASGQT